MVLLRVTDDQEREVLEDPEGERVRIHVKIYDDPNPLTEPLFRKLAEIDEILRKEHVGSCRAHYAEGTCTCGRRTR